MTDAAGSSGTGEVRASHRFDEARLAEWMAAHVGGYEGPLTVSQFEGGQSNPTYRLSTPNARYVLRRKPPGTLLKGAHAVEREARVIAALGTTGFPVPRVHGLCTDDAVIGTWFYVMDLVEGRIVWDGSLPDVAREARAAHYDAMNATIARLHTIDPDAIGLGDYGRPGNYFQRQIDRWTAQYLGDTEAGRDPAMDRLIEWLPANIPPEDGRAIVHGDYRIDNLIFRADAAQVATVLDWELSTLGHPLADFAYHLMMYRTPASAGTSGLVGLDLPALGIPAEADYVAAYCRRTGRAGIPALDFYLAFNFFRVAGILHGILGRIVRGTAASAQAREVAGRFPQMAALGWAQAERAG